MTMKTPQTTKEERLARLRNKPKKSKVEKQVLVSDGALTVSNK